MLAGCFAFTFCPVQRKLLPQAVYRRPLCHLRSFTGYELEMSLKPGEMGGFKKLLTGSVYGTYIYDMGSYDIWKIHACTVL